MILIGDVIRKQKGKPSTKAIGENWRKESTSRQSTVIDIEIYMVLISGEANSAVDALLLALFSYSINIIDR